MKPSIFYTTLAVAALSGCVAITPSPGAKEGDTPPRLVFKSLDDRVPTWDNPGNFGPIPASLMQKAQETCTTLNTAESRFEATGYHTKAQDVNGEAFVGGGFYCVERKK